MVHRLCEYHLMYDNMYSGVLTADQSKHVMTEGQRRAANGRHLKSKLKVLEEKGDLHSPERQFISIAHRYRNELYHVGLAHENIIRAIAGQYYLFCCDLFARTGNASVWDVSFSSDGAITDVMKRYLPKTDSRPYIFNVDDEVIAEKLRSALPTEMPNLPVTLSEDALLSIDMVMDKLDFLIEDNPRGWDGEAVLRMVQWSQDLQDTLVQEKVDGHWRDQTYQEEYVRVERELKTKWKQRYSSVPYEKWQRRGKTIKYEADPLAAIALYQLLRDEMSYLEEAIASMASILDRSIQDEIDRLRGK